MEPISLGGLSLGFNDVRNPDFNPNIPKSSQESAELLTNAAVHPLFNKFKTANLKKYDAKKLRIMAKKFAELLPYEEEELDSEPIL